MNAMILRSNGEVYSKTALVEIPDNTTLSYSVNNLISNEIDLLFVYPTLLDNTLLHKDLIQVNDILFIYNYGIFVIQNINYELNSSNTIRVNASYGYSFNDEIQLPLLNGVFSNVADLINSYFNVYYFNRFNYPITYTTELIDKEFAFFDTDFQWNVNDVYNNFQKQSSVSGILNESNGELTIEFEIKEKPNLVFDLALASKVDFDVNTDIPTMVNYGYYDSVNSQLGTIIASYSWNEDLTEIIDMFDIESYDKNFKPVHLISMLDDINDIDGQDYLERALSDLNELPYTLNIKAVYDIETILQYNNIDDILSDITGNVVEVVLSNINPYYKSDDATSVEEVYNIIKISVEEVSITDGIITINFGNSNKTINL